MTNVSPIHSSADDGEAAGAERRRKLKLLGREFNLPRSRPARIASGGGLVLLGMFGFLPVLGFWMVPVGLLVLSVDIAIVRRWRRRLTVHYNNRYTERFRNRRRYGENSTME